MERKEARSRLGMKFRVTYRFYFTPSEGLTSNTTHKMEYITILPHTDGRRKVLCCAGMSHGENICS